MGLDSVRNAEDACQAAYKDAKGHPIRRRRTKAALKEVQQILAERPESVQDAIHATQHAKADNRGHPTRLKRLGSALKSLFKIERN